MKPANLLTVKEAIELINSDTRENPVVKNSELIKRTEYLLHNFRGGEMNYTIFLVKRDKNGNIVPNGKKWAVVTNRRERDDLLNAITDHYRALSGRNVDPEQIGLYKQTNVIERDVMGSTNGMTRKNTASTLKYGDTMDTGTRLQTEKEN